MRLHISLSLLISFWSVSLKAQKASHAGDSAQHDVISDNTRNGFAFMPSKIEAINGVGFGWLTLDSVDPVQGTKRMNGLYINASPLVPLVVAYGGVMVVGMGISALFEKDTYKKRTEKERNYRDSVWRIDPTLREGFGKHNVNGVAISLMDFGEDFSIQGVQISAFHFADRLQGLSIAPLGSDYRELKGVMISGLFNISYKGTGTQIGVVNFWRKGKGLQIGAVNYSEERSGVQIGLINLSSQMKGVQIGLWNKIGNRSFPLINMSF